MRIKIYLLAGFFISTLSFSQIYSSGIKKIDPELWTDWNYWISGETPLSLSREKTKELVGKVISCTGECELYRSNAPGLLRAGMSVYEGDEINIYENSHLWLVTLTGDLLRLYPHTSLALNEINFSDHEWFIYLRLTQGGVTRISYNDNHQSFYDTLDSDQITLPIKWQEANLEYWLRKPNSENKMMRFRYFWEMHSKNNLKIKTKILLVAPNISIESLPGNNFDLFHQVGSESFAQNRLGKANLKLRNYDNPDQEFKPYIWFKVDTMGNEATPHRFEIKEEKKFLSITNKIVAQKIARELILSKLLGQMKSKVLNYHKWPKDDYDKRISFLHNYTQRIERSFLKSKAKILAIENISAQTFNLKALNEKTLLEDFALESTQKEFLEKIKAMSDLEYKLWVLNDR